MNARTDLALRIYIKNAYKNIHLIRLHVSFK